MGAVITIESDLRCPNCHQPMGWQSKRLTYDGFYLDVGQTVPLSDRVDGMLQGLCGACGKWFDVRIEKGQVSEVVQSEPLQAR